LKKIFIIVFAFLALFGCSDKSKEKIAVIGRSEAPFWNNLKLGAIAASKDLGTELSVFLPPKEDPAWQISKIEEAISEHYDGIAFSASDPKSIKPSITKAMEAGIPCIAIDTDLAKVRHAYIGTGNYYTGQQAAEIITELLQDKGKVAIIADSLDSDSLQRLQGFKDTIIDHRNIEIIAKNQNVVWTSQLEYLLSSQPQLNGLFCLTDATGAMAAEAIKKAGKLGLVKIVCVGESAEVLSQVQDGVIQAAISRRPYRMGYLSVMVLHNMTKAGIANTMLMLPVPGIIDLGVVIITPSNVIQYREELIKLGIKPGF